MSWLNARQTAVVAAIAVFAVVDALFTRAELGPADRAAVIAADGRRRPESLELCRRGSRGSQRQGTLNAKD